MAGMEKAVPRCVQPRDPGKRGESVRLSPPGGGPGSGPSLGPSFH